MIALAVLGQRAWALGTFRRCWTRPRPLALTCGLLAALLKAILIGCRASR